VLGRQAPTDLGQRSGILAAAKPVIQRLERDAVIGGLLLGPLVAVQIDPHRERGVSDGLDERGTPVPVAEIEVIVVGEDRLAAIDEVRVTVRAAVPPATPGRRLLLADPDHYHAVAALALGGLEVPASDLLLHIPLDEPDHRDLVLSDEPIDLLDVLAADLPQHRGRGNRETAIQQEPDHLTLGHQPRHVPLQKQPVHRPDLEAHMIGE
jgi:hypothetical protein